MKVSFKDKIRYQFDNLMSKGTIALVGILFLATAIVVLGAGFIMALLDGERVPILTYFWTSIMHVIDAGTITAADTNNLSFVGLMSLVTLCGIFITSILIGIITTGFEEKLNSLKKGNSRVIENDHIVVLGYDSNVFTLISELVTANENRSDGVIVLLSDRDKEEVEGAISLEIPDLKTSRIICRTGSITDKNMLSKCSLETCRAIIVNEKLDFMTIKAIISINNYFDTIGKNDSLPHIVATINKTENLEAVNVISKGNVELVLIENSVSRIIAQSCRQPGLSSVLLELFDYDGDDLYFEPHPELEGELFGDILNRFEKAVVFGYRRDGAVVLNPDKNEVMLKDDHYILLVEDDGMSKTVPYTKSSVDAFLASDNGTDTEQRIVIIGINDMLANIISELDNYYPQGSTVVVASEDREEELLNELHELRDNLKNIDLDFITCDTTDRKALEMLATDNTSHILLLSDYQCEPDMSDSMTLFKLIHLRDIAEKKGLTYSLTSEILDVANQKLASVAKVNDLVVGSNIINLILTQIAENRDLSTVFQEILSADGSEIYIRKAFKYLKLNTEMDFYNVTEILRRSGAIAIGYKKQDGADYKIVLNPNKSEKVVFGVEDHIILLASD